MNIKTASMILATATLPMGAKTTKIAKAAEKVAPKVERVLPQVGQEYGRVQVGMKFGSYFKKLEEIATRPEAEFYREKTIATENQTSFTHVITNKLDEVLASGACAYNKAENLSKTSLSDATKGLKYRGTTSNNPCKDVKFSRILGEEYSAVDKNGNGIVDAGEIYHNSQPPLGDKTGRYDEKNYKLNLSIK